MTLQLLIRRNEFRRIGHRRSDPKSFLDDGFHQRDFLESSARREVVDNVQLIELLSQATDEAFVLE